MTHANGDILTRLDYAADWHENEGRADTADFPSGLHVQCAIDMRDAAAEIRRLREALFPFVRDLALWQPGFPDALRVPGMLATAADVRRAMACLPDRTPEEWLDEMDRARAQTGAA